MSFNATAEDAEDAEEFFVVALALQMPHNYQQMGSETPQTIYDEVLYEDEPFSSTHPETLGSIGTLFGMKPADPRNCRLLELGAAQGRNLISMAYQFPQSQFVGLELSARQVENGRKLIADCGIRNLELMHLDILAAGPDLGKFDYIVSHGTLSWVPPAVRQKMFQICAANLSPNGIAYLSYNTFPGWKSREVFRDLMLFEGREAIDSAAKVQRARGALNAIGRVIAHDQSQFNLALRAELPQFQHRPDWYFIHDFIAENNQPFYFFEIMDQARAVGLQYLGDTELAHMGTFNLPAEAQEALRPFAADPLRFEQYGDVLRNRKFRRTLLCHQAVELKRKIEPHVLQQFYFAAPLKPAGDPSSDPGKPIRFTHPSGGAIDTAEPAMQKVFHYFGEVWPENLTYAEVVAVSGLSPTDAANVLAPGLFRGVFADLIQIRLNRSPAARTITKKPKASLLARIQAAGASRVMTLLHESVELSDAERRGLLLLDGAHSEPQLLKALKITNPDELRELLEKFASYGLLERENQ